jgi:hypothetical protein
MSKPERFTNATGAPVADNTNIMTAGRRGPAFLGCFLSRSIEFGGPWIRIWIRQRGVGVARGGT